MPFVDELKRTFKSGSIIIKLIFINVGVFLVVNIINLLFVLFTIDPVNAFSLIDWLAVPADIKQLVYRFWTPITYMFLHEGIFHILFNMLILYWFGTIFLQYLNEKQLFGVYILGGISGAFLYLAMYNIFPVFNTNAINLGASGAVTAILIAISFYVPNYSIGLLFIGRIQLKYIAVGVIIIDIISINSANAGGHIAHLGGALFGYLFIQQYKKANDITSGFSKFMDNIVTMLKPEPKLKVHYKAKEKSRKKTRSESDYEYNKRKATEQEEVDRILDKISQSGYNSLTKREKELLFRQSDKNI